MTLDAERRDVFQLATFRSQGQFNTTVYSDRDRFRVVFGTRMVLFMNRKISIGSPLQKVIASVW